MFTVYFSGNTASFPGDTVLLSGFGLDQITGAGIGRLDDSDTEIPSYIAVNSPVRVPTEDEIAGASEPLRGDDVRHLKLIQQSVNSLKFIIPNDLPMGVYAVTLTAGDSVQTVYLNQPVLKWTQGDCGSFCSAGGWLRISGENLSLGQGETKVVLLKDGTYRSLPVDRVYDPYSVGVKIPADLSVGDYTAIIHNGYGGNTAWSMPLSFTVGKPEEFPAEVFNVRDYGACGTGEADDTDAFRSALEAVGKNGGGTLYVPRGRYKLTGPITLPDHTVFKGESVKRTQLYWIPFGYPFGQLPEAYITAQSDVTIEDIEFRGTRVLALFKAGGECENPKNIRLNRIIADFNGLAGSEFHVTSPENRCKIYNEILAPDLKGSLIRIVGDNIQITDSEFHSTGMSFGPIGKKYKKNVFFKGNKVYERISGWAYFARCEHLILEDNDFEGCTVGFGGADCYMARNFIHDTLNNDREALTTDMSYSKLSAHPVKIEGNKVIFEKGISLVEDRVNLCGLYVNSGKGAGQARRVTAYHENEVTIDQPFAVEPDENSELCFGGMYRASYYVVGNTVRNAGHLQFYCDQTSSVLDGNTMTRSAGLMLYGWQQDKKTPLPGEMEDFTRTEIHFVSIVNNSVAEGNYLHKYGEKADGYVDGWSGYSSIGLTTHGPRPNIVGITLRGNTLCDNALLQFRKYSNQNGILEDLIVERNTVHDSRRGIYFDNAVKSGVIRNNDLSENVDEPLILPEDTSGMILENNLIAGN